MTDEEWLSKVQETVRVLDSIGFEGSSRDAQDALRLAGVPTGREQVLSALRLRKGGDPGRCPGSLSSDLKRWKRRLVQVEEEADWLRAKIEAAG